MPIWRIHHSIQIVRQKSDKESLFQPTTFAEMKRFRARSASTTNVLNTHSCLTLPLPSISKDWTVHRQEMRRWSNDVRVQQINKKEQTQFALSVPSRCQLLRCVARRLPNDSHLLQHHSTPLSLLNPLVQAFSSRALCLHPLSSTFPLSAL